MNKDILRVNPECRSRDTGEVSSLLFLSEELLAARLTCVKARAVTPVMGIKEIVHSGCLGDVYAHCAVVTVRNLYHLSVYLKDTKKNGLCFMAYGAYFQVTRDLQLLGHIFHPRFFSLSSVWKMHLSSARQLSEF